MLVRYSTLCGPIFDDVNAVKSGVTPSGLKLWGDLPITLAEGTLNNDDLSPLFQEGILS